MESNELELIRQLIPFNKKSEAELKKYLASVKITNFSQGKMIFKRAVEDTNLYWLISGAIDLLDENFQVKSRNAAEAVAKYPLDNNSPHRLTAISTTKSRILTIDRAELAWFSPSDAVSEVNNHDDAVDWMSALLSSPLFESVPPVNIQQLFSKFEQVKYNSGDIVITQGDVGDYFYVIQSGDVKVERTTADKTLLLAKFSRGDHFGQDALVSDVPRNATVTMLTNGTLMRLSEANFESLLVQPVIETVTLDEAQEMVRNDDPKTYILDVRSHAEYEQDLLKGSQNVPLLLLINRKNLSKLKTGAIYVTKCDGGKRAELAAYILNENGFMAYVLK